MRVIETHNPWEAIYRGSFLLQPHTLRPDVQLTAAERWINGKSDGSFRSRTEERLSAFFST